MSTPTRRQILTALAAVPAAGALDSTLRSASQAAPADPAAGLGATASLASRGRGCADPDEVPLLLHRDMVGHHAGLMHGVPLTYSWAKKPWLVLGNHPGSFRAMNPWGQVYEWAGGSPARNVRVACRDMSGWILSRRTGRWHQVAAARGVYGANYVESFVDNANRPAALRVEPDGATSATLGGGYNFHFAPMARSRVTIDPDDIAGLITLYSARVIMDDPNGPDERAEARWLASCGADYWTDPYTDGTGGNTGPAGVGKARWVTPEWRTYTFSTLPLHKLQRTCPPLCLRGR